MASTRLRFHGFLVERRVDAAFGIDALFDGERQVARHERLRVVEEHVKRILVRPLAEQEHVAEALGAEDADLAAFLLDDGVRRDRRAVREEAGVHDADVFQEIIERLLIVLGRDAERP